MIARSDYPLADTSHATATTTLARAHAALGEQYEVVKAARARWEAMPYEGRQTAEAIVIGMALDAARGDEHTLHLVVQDLRCAQSDAWDRESRPHDPWRRFG